MRLVYRKVKHISQQGNSEKCLVLRQAWSMNFLQMDFKNKLMINIDGKYKLETKLIFLFRRDLAWNGRFSCETLGA